MSTVYLLDCECGRSVELRKQQAGSEVTCQNCDRKIIAPTFRELSKLPTAGKSTPVRKRPTWTRSKGLLFSFGLPLFLLGFAICATLVYLSSQLMTERPTLEQALARYGMHEEDMSEFTPIQTWHVWLRARGVSIEAMRAYEPYYEGQRRIAKRYQVYIVMSGILGAIGLACLLAMPFARPSPGRRSSSENDL